MHVGQQVLHFLDQIPFFQLRAQDQAIFSSFSPRPGGLTESASTAKSLMLGLGMRCELGCATFFVKQVNVYPNSRNEGKSPDSSIVACV